MANQVHVTVNGVPVEKVIDEEIRAEYRSHRSDEVKAMSTLVASGRKFASRVFRNHSRARTGRGRVIYSAAMAGGAA